MRFRLWWQIGAVAAYLLGIGDAIWELAGEAERKMEEALEIIRTGPPCDGPVPEDDSDEAKEPGNG